MVPTSSLLLRYAAAPAPAATGHTIGQKKNGKPRPAVPRPITPGYPLPYVLKAVCKGVIKKDHAEQHTLIQKSDILYPRLQYAQRKAARLE